MKKLTLIAAALAAGTATYKRYTSVRARKNPVTLVTDATL